MEIKNKKYHPARRRQNLVPPVSAPPLVGIWPAEVFYVVHFDKIRMSIKSIQTNAKTPSDTVVAQLRQEKKVCNHKNQRNEDPTTGVRKYA